jgi:Gas vesicle protein K
MTQFAQILHPASEQRCVRPDAPVHARLSLDPENVKNGLGQLVLTLVKLLHELLERQALRRIDGGSLSDEQIERLGLTLMRQAEEIDRLRKEFGLEEQDLNLDLGPIGRLF